MLLSIPSLPPRPPSSSSSSSSSSSPSLPSDEVALPPIHIVTEAEAERRIGLLTAQLSSMEKAFTVQERALSQLTSSSSSSSLPYSIKESSSSSGPNTPPPLFFKLLQTWRQQVLRSLLSHRLSEDRLRETIAEKKYLRDRSALDTQVLIQYLFHFTFTDIIVSSLSLSDA